jgi:pimeloyl-ACP methyl ester carboxylesterase
MKEYKSEETSIHYKRLGKGKPLLLLHGFLEDHSMWNPLIPFFNEWGYEVIVFDLPCHGMSRYAKESCSMEEMAACIHDFSLSKDINNARVLGHSMGGYVGLELLHLGNYDLTLLHSNFWEDSETKKRDRDRVQRGH